MTVQTDVMATITLREVVITSTPEPIRQLPTEPVELVSTPVVETAVFESLQQQMLKLINQARVVEGLNTVDWDEVATESGRLHSEDMVQFNYFSHWNQEGLGPEHRYMLLGGKHAVMENLHAFSYTYNDGRGAPIEDWNEVIQNAHNGLMNSPGHYANIMDPAHTHVGIGIAYNHDTGQFRLAQEFTNQYVQIVQPIPTRAALGEEIVVNGRILPSNLSNILLNLAYEPFPTPMSRDELDATSTYRSRAESIDTIAIPTEFDEVITISTSGESGFYHIRIFGDLPTGQALLMNRIITVP